MDRRDALKAVGVLGIASVENALLAGEQPTKSDRPPSSPPGYQGEGTKATGPAMSNAPPVARPSSAFMSPIVGGTPAASR